MSTLHRRIAIALALTLAISACVPDPANRPTPPPTTPAPSQPANPTPLPTPAGPTPTPSFVRPTPTPLPTFLAYVVVAGDTLTSIARRHATTARSIAYWNRATYPTLDPDSAAYDPNDIRIGWVLLLIPNAEVDPEEPPPTPVPTPTPAPTVRPSPSPSPTTGATGPSRIVSHGSRTKSTVALTLDMGGRLDPAVAIMDWLIEHRVKATIFPTGKSASTTIGRQVLARIKAHPDLFDVGNHSWDHPSFVDLTAAQMRDQLVRTEQVVLDGTGMSSKPWFRPPFGSRNQAVLDGVGAAGWAYTVMWDVDTIDWRPTSDGGPTATQIVDKVVSKGQNGSIVLMHLGGWHTLEALPGIVDGLAARGLTPVTLGEMFGR